MTIQEFIDNAFTLHLIEDAKICKNELVFVDIEDVVLARIPLDITPKTDMSEVYINKTYLEPEDIEQLKKWLLEFSKTPLCERDESARVYSEVSEIEESLIMSDKELVNEIENKKKKTAKLAAELDDETINKLAVFRSRSSNLTAIEKKVYVNAQGVHGITDGWRLGEIVGKIHNSKGCLTHYLVKLENNSQLIKFRISDVAKSCKGDETDKYKGFAIEQTKSGRYIAHLENNNFNKHEYHHLRYTAPFGTLDEVKDLIDAYWRCEGGTQ